METELIQVGVYRTDLVFRHMGIALSQAVRFHRRFPGCGSSADMRDVAVMALVEAARRYNPGHVSSATGQPVAESTFIYVWVRGRLLTHVRNVMAEAARKRKAASGYTAHFRLGVGKSFRHVPDRCAAQGLSERRDVAEFALSCLEEPTRTFARLHWLEGMTRAEIGRRHGITKVAVSRRLNLAVEKMAAFLRGNGVTRELALT